MPVSQNKKKCTCGCNRLLSRWQRWRHFKAKALAIASTVQPESPPPPKRRRIAHIQADTGSSSSDQPQLHTPSFDFSPSLPSLDPPAALDLLQSPGDGRTIPSGRFFDDVLLSLHARTHRTTDESDNEDSDDALEGDAAEAANTIDPGTDDSWDEEDVEDEVDPREGIVSDWDTLAEEFIVEAERLGKFEVSLLHTPVTYGVFAFRRVFHLGP